MSKVFLILVTYAVMALQNAPTYVNPIRCKVKKVFFELSFVRTTSTQVFGCVIPTGVFYFDCHYPIIICIITCSGCSVQYVEYIAKKPNQRCK